MNASFDIVIAGAGPAGWALARALVERGMRVALVDPTVDSAWDHTLGLWADEVVPSLEPAIAQRWHDTHVGIGGATQSLGRGYARIDNARFYALFRTAFVGLGGVMVRAGVRFIHRHRGGTEVALDNGETLHAWLAVDATGSGLFTPRSGAPSAWQVAVGYRLEGAHPYDPAAMRLMDFHAAGLCPASAPPSFLYAMPFEGGVFVEETALITHDALGAGELERRLSARLARDGVTARRVGEPERVRIPMNAPLPDAPAHALPFGAAAGFIHPATGYSVGRSVREAGPLAELLAELRPTADPAVALARGWSLLWPASVRRAHRIAVVGARVLAGLDSRQSEVFFRSFFSIDRALWSAYLDGTAPLGVLARAMLATFAASPMSLRLRLLRSGIDPSTLAALTHLSTRSA